MNLYEIDSAITSCVDEETGEIIDFEKLSELLMERDTLDKRMKSAESKAKSLREWLKNALECKPFETAKVRVSFRKSEQTEVDESVLDRKWCREKVTYTPDKTAIKNAIKSGQTVDGARIVVNQNIQIK